MCCQPVPGFCTTGWGRFQMQLPHRHLLLTVKILHPPLVAAPPSSNQACPCRVKRLIATQIQQLTCHQIHLPSGNLRAIGVSNQCNYAGVIWKPWQPARLKTQNPKPKQSDGGCDACVCVLLLNSERGENCQLNNAQAAAM